MANSPCPNGLVNPSIERALRTFIKTAFESGYADIDYERFKEHNTSVTLNKLLGISREDCNRVIWDELTNIATKIRREHELRQTQSARF